MTRRPRRCFACKLVCVACCALASGLIAGCGGPSRSVPRQDAKASLQQGRDALANGDFAAAENALRSAVESGGLLPDDYCDALTLHSLALAKLNRLDEAHASLDRAAQGAGDMAAVHAARAEVLRQQGKTAEANRAYSEAKKLNPQIAPFGK